MTRSGEARELQTSNELHWHRLDMNKGGRRKSGGDGTARGASWAASYMAGMLGAPPPPNKLQRLHAELRIPFFGATKYVAFGGSFGGHFLRIAVEFSGGETTGEIGEDAIKDDRSKGTHSDGRWRRPEMYMSILKSVQHRSYI
jgi:hypothetical protein